MGGILHVVGKVFKTVTRAAPAIAGGIMFGPAGAIGGGALSGAFQKGNKLRNMGMGALTGAISYGVGNYASGAFAKSYGTQMLNTFGTNVGGGLLQAPLYITQAYGATSAANGAREAYMQSVAKRSAKEALGSGLDSGTESSALQYLSESSAMMQGQIAAELQATRELDAQRMKFREESQARLMEAFFKNMPKPQPVNITFPALEDKIEEPPVIRPLDPKVENEPIQQMVFARNAHRTRRRTIDQYNYKGFEKPKKNRAIGLNPFADLTVKNG